MSDQTSMKVQVYSPRWGHDDTYAIEMTRDWMKIERHPRSATCKWVENRDPTWESTDGSLLRIFANDSICPPEIFQWALQGAWIDWRSGDIDDTKVKTEIEELFEWLNTTTKAKPKSDYWRKKF